MLRTEQLEREAESRRLALADTLDELRARATPGNLLDHLISHASSSGGTDIARNLKDQVITNPLAVGLIGAGLAWLMMSNGRGTEGTANEVYEPEGYGMSGHDERSGAHVRRYFTGTHEWRAGHAMNDAMSEARHFVGDAAMGTAHMASRMASGVASGAAHMASGAAHMASDAASSAASSLASAARSARDTTIDTVSSVGGEARHTIGDAASALYGGVAHSAERTASGMRAFASGTASTSRDMYDLARDQPLVLAGLGLAFGAAMGTLFPSTETERQLMGEASEELKERTHTFAAENYEKSKSVAEALFQNQGNDSHSQNDESRSVPVHSSSRASLVPLDQDLTNIDIPPRPERVDLRDLTK